MYLKPDRKLFRERRGFWGARLLIVALLLGGMGFVGYRAFQSYAEPLIAGSSTPTPVPTATPAAGYYAAQGDDAYWQGATGEAIAAYQASLDMQPGQTELYLALARLLTFQGHPERGLEMARQALARQPDNALAWALLGMTYDWLGLTNQAVTYCQHAVDLDPTLPEAYAYLAEAYIDDGQWFSANDAMATAMELDDTNVDVLRDRAYVLESQGNYYGAIQAYRDAIALNDKLVHLYLGIGRNAGALGNLQTALEAYQDAVAVDPNHALALDQLGWTQLLLGDYTSARENLTAALELDPDLADAYGHLGTLYFHQRNYEDAIVEFGPAIEYAEARSRRRTVLFVVTAEEINAIGETPSGAQVAVAEFLHPTDLQTPLRGQFTAAAGGASIDGQIRFDVMTGKYDGTVSGIPPAPSGKVYVGWFLQLFSPEGRLVHTDPIFPAPNGQVVLTGTTGHVKGPPIENYYSFALSYYLLDQCDKAIPLINVALQIDPADANAQAALDLCR